MRWHPVRSLMAHGVPVTISSDDPTFWDYKGLNLDFTYAFISWQLDLKDMKQLAINGIKQSSISNEQKYKLLNLFKKDWDSFINSMAGDETAKIV